MQRHTSDPLPREPRQVLLADVKADRHRSRSPTGEIRKGIMSGINTGRYSSHLQTGEPWSWTDIISRHKMQMLRSHSLAEVQRISVMNRLETQ